MNRTGPGEIARGDVQVALNKQRRNWMASWTNVLIHEVVLFQARHIINSFFAWRAVEPGSRRATVARSLRILAWDPRVFGEASCADRPARRFQPADHLAMARPLREDRPLQRCCRCASPMIDQPISGRSTRSPPSWYQHRQGSSTGCQIATPAWAVPGPNRGLFIARPR